MIIAVIVAVILAAAAAGCLARVAFHDTGHHAHKFHDDQPAPRRPLPVTPRYEHPYPPLRVPPWTPTATAWTPRELADITMPCITPELLERFERLIGSAA